MAATKVPPLPSLQIHRLPQSQYIDEVRFLPAFSALDRFVVFALFDTHSSSPSLQIHSLPKSSSPPSLDLQSSLSLSSRVSSLSLSTSPHKPLIAASTFSGSLHLLLLDFNASVQSEFSVPEKSLHAGAISCVDLQENGVECVTVAEDGRVNLVGLGDGSRLNYRRVWDSDGLASFTAAKWASPTEFATGEFGFGLQWWDMRKPGGSVSQCKGNWAQRMTSGIVHSIDIHPSRKHTCLAGGSSGTVFAWDLRWQQKPIILSGVGTGEVVTHSPCESEVWEVKYDPYTQTSNFGNISSSRILPAMICSEDGILAVVEEGEAPTELLAEPCAINSFDIDRQNPAVSEGSESFIVHALSIVSGTWG